MYGLVLSKEKIPKTPKTYENGNVPIVPVPYAWRFSNEGIVLCASHDRFSRRDAQTTTPISLYLPKKTAHPRRPPLRPSQCKQNVQLMYHATTELPPPTNALPNISKVKSPISLIIHRNYIHTPVPPNRRPFPTQAKGPNLPYHTYILLQNFHPNLPLSYIILTLETSTPHSPPINRSTNQPIRFQPCARREKEKKSGLRD